MKVHVVIIDVYEEKAEMNKEKKNLLGSCISFYIIYFLKINIYYILFIISNTTLHVETLN